MNAVIARAMFTLALLCTWFLLFVFGASGLQQARTQEELYGDLRQKLSLATAPLGGQITPGTPVAVLAAPTIGLHQVVVEGTDSGVMRAGPGHRRNSPLPGQPGTSVVYGHAATFGGPFRRIPLLHTGDLITVTTGQGQFGYQVTGVRRAADPLPAPLPRGGGRLVLVTAEASGWRTGWAANQVLYVDATLHGESQLGPPGRPSGVDTAELALQSNPDALVTLVLWLQILGAAAIASTWARRRWGGAQTWLVGAPVLLAGLWGTADALAQLLPNLS